MKTILVTGGTDGIGKGVTLDYLKKDIRLSLSVVLRLKGNGFMKKQRSLMLQIEPNIFKQI